MVTIVSTIVTIPTIKNPIGWDAQGTGTFIPKKLAIMVGIAITMVTDARNFMTIFRLFEITEANASIIPAKTSV